jgi:hypothetical protein
MLNTLKKENKTIAQLTEEVFGRQKDIFQSIEENLADYSNSHIVEEKVRTPVVKNIPGTDKIILPTKRDPTLKRKHPSKTIPTRAKHK